ncbi:MAG TPA: fibronectin type III domain-containing protein [Micromonosporaceae bacterium]|nr:fibronectin type III domain-containing protein [Micromonosporaceae bacterium]
MRTTTIRTLAAAFLVIGLAVAGGTSASASRGKPKPSPSPSPSPSSTPPLEAPADLHVAAVTQTTVTLAWSPSTDSRVTSYWVSTRVDLDRITGGGHEVISGLREQEVPVPETSVTFSSLKAGFTYTFRVYARGDNISSESRYIDATTSPDVVAPSAPTGLALADKVDDEPVDGVTASKVLLTWTNSTDDFGPIDYQVLVDGVPTANMFNTKRAGAYLGTTTTAWVRQLKPATTYTLAVRAVDHGGNISALSNSVTVTTDPGSGDTVAPSTPTLTHFGLGGPGGCPMELWLKWTESTDDVEQASDIEYEIRLNGTILRVSPGRTEYVATSATKGANTITIVAVDRSGNASDPSNAMTRDVNFSWTYAWC